MNAGTLYKIKSDKVRTSYYPEYICVISKSTYKGMITSLYHSLKNPYSILEEYDYDLSKNYEEIK